MEVSCVFRQLLRQAVIHLIEKGMHILVALIFQRDPRLFPEGHGKIQVEPSGGIDGHRQGIYRIGHAEAAAEQVSQRAFHGRGLLPVPVHPQHQIPQHIAVPVARPVRHRDPDVPDDARPVHFRQRYGLSRPDQRDTGRALSGRPQIACRHAALSLFSRPVLPVDAPALSRLKTVNVFKSVSPHFVFLPFRPLFLSRFFHPSLSKLPSRSEGQPFRFQIVFYHRKFRCSITERKSSRNYSRNFFFSLGGKILRLTPFPIPAPLFDTRQDAPIRLKIEIYIV